MRNLLLTLSYDGSNYHGWQVQKNAPTVQQTLCDAWEKISGKRENITGCSRTDSGVHANMFCCSLKTDSGFEEGSVIRALNAGLPFDIAVSECRETPEDFHPRYSCVSKQYIYKIWNAPVRNPFLTKHALHYKYELDEELLNAEAARFIGQHDFSSFCASGSSVEDNTRNLMAASVSRSGNEVIFSFEANGFLYNMVRIMAGTLLEIAQGKIERESIAEIIQSKNRKNAGATAPAHALYLNRVNY